jgi:hypothetical protein
MNFKRQMRRLSCPFGGRPGTLQNIANFVAGMFGNQADNQPSDVTRVVVVGGEGDGDERTLIDLFKTGFPSQ